MRFSEYYNLNKSQLELDFVDIPLETDIKLFVDPYAFKLESDPWYINCNNLVVGFFQLVLDHIGGANPNIALELLSSLREPNDTHLGFSKRRPSGRGVGKIQAKQIFQRLCESEAAQSGFLSDLEDCELMIPGISSDKISDIAINIIRRQLIEYTQYQCNELDVPMFSVASGIFWDYETDGWNNLYLDLPVYNNQRIVLVPKAAVRYRMTINHLDYYQKYVLEYLQAENINANTSLVKVLQNGRRVVYKNQLKEMYPLSKQFLYEFSRDNPDVLQRYKRGAKRYAIPLTVEEIESVHPEPKPVNFCLLIDKLTAIPTGTQSAADYHDIIFEILKALLYPDLRNGVKELKIQQGLKRVDIAFYNAANSGFFNDLIRRHNVFCPYIMIECKNYGSEIGNPALDQLLGRFSRHRGNFGIIICRSLNDRDHMIGRCRATLREQDKHIIVLEDNDIIRLIEFRAILEYRGFNNLLLEKLNEIIL